MLHYKTVEPGTLSILRQLMAMPELDAGLLVGGTALALYCGHRKSVDLDVFTSEAFNREGLVKALTRQFRNEFEYEHLRDTDTLFGFISDVKVDVVHYPLSLVASMQVEDGLRLASMADIAAMKINAVLGRGQKKDFFDIFELLNHFSLEQIFTFYQQKYQNQMLVISLPEALVYFTDAEQSEDPHSLNGTDWKTVKTTIRKAVREFLA